MSIDALRTGDGPRVPRRDQAAATRALLLRTAERLYAERGLAGVSHRQIVEAAGVANNSALTYHFGTRDDLIRAIARSHAGPVLRRTRELLARGPAGPRDRVAAFVLPYTEHLATLGTPSWCARFTAQLAADPAFGERLDEDSGLRELVDRSETVEALRAHVPGLSAPEMALRCRMVRLTVIHTCAEQERLAAAPWDAVGAALTDALTGLLLAPRGTT